MLNTMSWLFKNTLLRVEPMNSIYQKLAIVAAGTTLGLTVLEMNPAQATIGLPNQTAAVVRDQSFSDKVENSQQGQRADLNTRESTLLAQAKPYKFSTYYLSTKTDNKGYFSVKHGLSSKYTIYGMTVAVQHKNGNWHTLEFSHNVDNRFWWNTTYVQGYMASPNFYNRNVYILLTVYP